MEQERLTNKSIANQIYSILKQQVIDGTYRPGEKISEQTVADRYGISRSPVREAIRQLANEGLIDYFPNRGAFVKSYTAKMVKDSVDVRLLLEKYAIANIEPTLLEEYREDLLQLRETIRVADRSDYIALDAELHETIVKLCGNEALMSLYRLLYSQILAFREISLVDESMFQLATRSHVAILTAILSGQTERAERLITKHLTESAEQVQMFFSPKDAENA